VTQARCPVQQCSVERIFRDLTVRGLDRSALFPALGSLHNENFKENSGVSNKTIAQVSLFFGSLVFGGGDPLRAESLVVEAAFRRCAAVFARPFQRLFADPCGVAAVTLDFSKVRTPCPRWDAYGI